MIEVSNRRPRGHNAVTLLAWQFVALVEVLLTPYAEQRFTLDEDKVNYVVRIFLDGCSRQRCQAER